MPALSFLASLAICCSLSILSRMNLPRDVEAGKYRDLRKNAQMAPNLSPIENEAEYSKRQSSDNKEFRRLPVCYA